MRSPYQRKYGLDLPRHTSEEVMSAAREAAQAEQANYQKGQPMNANSQLTKRDYVFTDGQEVFATRYLTKDEANELNRKARQASGGEVQWQLKNPPVTDLDPTDYVFIDAGGNLLAPDSLAPDDAAEMAQTLARRYRTTVSYAEVVEYNVEPDRCECGEILHEDNTCPSCSFESEAI